MFPSDIYFLLPEMRLELSSSPSAVTPAPATATIHQEISTVSKRRRKEGSVVYIIFNLNNCTSQLLGSSTLTSILHRIYRHNILRRHLIRLKNLPFQVQ